MAADEFSDLAFSGLYAKLKDRNTSLEEKLQVFRFAWKSKDVFIPNKEQVLIDQLCGILINKKKHQFTEQEIGKIFKCLQDVLVSKKAHRRQKDGQGLLVKQTLSQMVTDTLWSQVSRTTDEGDYLKYVVGCTQAIVSSPTLAYVFTDRLDLMISLQGCLCEILYESVTKRGEHPNLTGLVKDTTDLFIKCQSSAHDQNMLLRITCEKLLVPFFKLCSVSRSDEVMRIADVVLNVLCHKDHSWSYSSYLLGLYENKLPEEAEFTQIELVNQLFKTLSNLLESQDTLAEAMCDVLVQFYDKMVVNNRNEEDQKVSHYLLRKLCTVIGVNDKDSTLKETVAPPVVITGIRKLLDITLKYDLYNVSVDNRNGYIQLKFYRTIVKILLDNISPTVDWYSCCHILLQMNHHTIEPSLTSLLTKGWISVQEKLADDTLLKMDEFLQELILTYHKLRQFPKLIDVLLNTLKCCSGNEPVELPRKFLKSFGECVQSLPQATMVDVWNKILSHMIEEFATKQPLINTSHFHGVCLLFYHYIINVKVIDYSITDVTLKCVKDNLESMCTDLFHPLMWEQQEKHQVDATCLSSILNLCYGWGEVVAMVVMYTKYNMEKLQTKSLHRKADDVSYVHSYLKKKQWRQLHKLIQMSENMCLQYYWEMLTVQKIRVILLCRDVSDWSAIHESMEMLMNFPVEISTEMKTVTWSGMTDDITSDNILVARWNLLVNNMPILYGNLSQENMESIAAFIISTATHTNESSRNGMTLGTITRDFMESTQVRECGGLITCIITGVWQSMMGSLAGKRNRSKKRKLSAGLETAVEVFSVLSDSKIDWKQAVNSESLEKILDASKYLTTLLKDFNKDAATVPESCIKSCLQVISWLPLEHISSCDQIRCLIGLLSTNCLLECAMNQSNSEDCEKLAGECLKLCTVILESSSMSPVFQVIDVDTYLSWLTVLIRKQSEMDSRFFKKMLFVEFSCSCIIKDYKVLVKIPEFVQKVKAEIVEKDFDPHSKAGGLVVIMYLMQETSRMLRRPYLNESIRDVCRLVLRTLSKEVLGLCSILGSGSFTKTQAIVINALSMMVYSTVKDEELQADMIKKLLEILSWCENVLKGETATFPKMASLHFLHAITRCHKAFNVVLTEDMKHMIWSLLVELLRNLLKKKSVPVNLSKQTFQKTEYEKNRTDNGNGNEFDSEMVLDLLCEKPVSVRTEGIEVSNLLREEIKAVTLSNDVVWNSFSNDGVYKPSVISSLYHSLAFEGKLQDQSTELLLAEVQATMASVLASFDMENFRTAVEDIVADVHTCNLSKDRQKIQCYLFVWQYLLKLEFSADHSQIIQAASEKIVSNSQCIQQQVHHLTSPVVAMDTVLPILQVQRQMLNISSRFLSSKASALCLQGCVSVMLEGPSLVPIFHAVCDLLDTLLIKHTKTVIQNIPSFIGCAKKLLVSLVKQSDQTKVSGNARAISDLSNCAYQLERLFLEISNHKLDFNKVAVYVISDYVTAVEQVTLLPSLKRALLPVVYKMLDLCDNFAIAQLHQILSYGEVEVFRILYNEYKKFHKFSGKV